jgi:hypothetical protein
MLISRHFEGLYLNLLSINGCFYSILVKLQDYCPGLKENGRTSRFLHHLGVHQRWINGHLKKPCLVKMII